MSEMRRSAIYQGAVAGLLLSTALLTASVFLGPSASMSTNVIASIAVLAQLVVAFICLGFLGRTVVRHLVLASSRKLERRIESLSAERRDADDAVLGRVDESRVALIHAVQDSEKRLDEQAIEHAKSAGSLARSYRLQTEALAVIRRQTRATLNYHEVHGEDTLRIASENRDMSRKLLNVVRNDRRAANAQIGEVESALREVERRWKEVEAGQRRTMNFLRKEGSVQEVLGRLVAAERRLTASIEASALTHADSVARATSESIEKVRDYLAALREEIGQISQRTDAIGADLEGATPRIEQFAPMIEDLSSSNRRSLNEAQVTLASLREEIGQISQRTDAIGADLEGASPRIEQLAPMIEDLSSFNRRSIDEALVTMNELHQQLNQVRTAVKSVGPRIDRNGIDVVKQVEALIQLLGRVDTSAHRLPSSGGWAMTPDSLLLLSDIVREKRPNRIVELGSGSSTVWVGTFAKAVGATLYSIEHLEEYRATTADSLDAFDLSGTVDLRLAELTEIDLGGQGRQWYQPTVFEDLSDIDILIVDGPPQSTGPEPRYPAFPMLREKLAPGALIVVDDLHREPENKMVEDWMAQDSRLEWTAWGAGRTGVLRIADSWES